MWVSILSILATLIPFILGRIGASEATKKAFMDAFANAGNEGLISAQAHDKIKDLRDKLKAMPPPPPA